MEVGNKGSCNAIPAMLTEERVDSEIGLVSESVWTVLLTNKQRKLTVRIGSGLGWVGYGLIRAARRIAAIFKRTHSVLRVLGLWWCCGAG